MEPSDFYHLSERDPEALARALAQLDADGVRALSERCAAWIARRDGVRMEPLFLRGAWLRRGLITAEQAGFTAEAIA